MPENQNFVTEEQLNQMMEEGGLAPAEQMPTALAGKSAPAMPTMPQGSTAPFFSGSLPPQFQLDSSFSRARAISSRVPHNDLMPLGTQSNPSVNAGTNSTARVLAKTPGFTNMDLVNNGQTRVAMATASSTPGSTGGSVAFNFRGVWLAVVPYFKGDEVIYQTSYWMATAASTNSAPATGNANWQVVGSYAAFRGPWSSSTAYVAGDEVTYNGNFWVATTANTNSAPSTSNSNWVIAGPNNLDAVQDGSTFGRMPISNYGQQTPIGKMTGLEVSSNADLEFGLTNYSVYDNNASGSVTITTVSDSASPNGNGIKMKIVEAKVGAGPTPGLGGFTYSLRLDNGVISGDTYHVGDTYIIDLVANIPVGYTLNFNNNSLGTGGSFQYLNSSLAGSSTAPVGTGNWQHYLVKVIIGTSPSSTNAFPFFYLTGADGVTWYVAGMEILDIDQHPRKSGGPIRIGPYPTGTKFGHGIGINGAGGSVGVVMHGGNNRHFLTSDPFTGIYGSPSLPHQIFMNGGYVGHDVSSINNPRVRVNSTGGGREYSLMSNVDGTARINDETGGAARTYLNSTPQWGFFGSPSSAFEIQSGGGPAKMTADSTGPVSPAWAVNDTHAGGRQFWFNTGGYNGLGVAGFADQTANSGRTYLNSTPQWGYYGSPGAAVHNFGGAQRNETAGIATFQANDTRASGQDFAYESGSSAAGVGNITQVGANQRTFLNTTPQWGYYGTPGSVTNLNADVELFGRQFGGFATSGVTPRTGLVDTSVSGRVYGLDNGSFAGLDLAISDLSANAGRIFMDGSNNIDLHGATPTSGLITAASGNIADTSGNLKLKNINNAVGTTNSPTTTATSYVVVPEMTVTITTKGNKVFVDFSGSFAFNNTTGSISLAIFRDGSQLSQDIQFSDTGTNNLISMPICFIDTGASAANHTYDVRWKIIAGTSNTLTANGVQRQIQVVELG